MMFILARHLQSVLSKETMTMTILPFTYCQVAPHWYDILSFVLWVTKEKMKTIFVIVVQNSIDPTDCRCMDKKYIYLSLCFTEKNRFVMT